MIPMGTRPIHGGASALTLALTLALASAAASAQPSQPAATAGGDAKRGEYLVKSVGCGDCHTPMKMGANGPEPDASRMLSGHPAAMQLPPPPAASGPWIASVAATMTAWAGPWGVSYTANLTPDPETGLGKWTEQQFVETLRTGRHLGRGREILPPMPWPALRNMTDQDLKAVYAYLRTIPAISNKVPDPAPPAGPPQH
jgi:mono/diheme cytochrome c family protein